MPRSIDRALRAKACAALCQLSTRDGHGKQPKRRAPRFTGDGWDCNCPLVPSSVNAGSLRFPEADHRSILSKREGKEHGLPNPDQALTAPGAGREQGTTHPTPYRSGGPRGCPYECPRSEPSVVRRGAIHVSAWRATAPPTDSLASDRPPGSDRQASCRPAPLMKAWRRPVRSFDRANQGWPAPPPYTDALFKRANARPADNFAAATFWI